MLERRYSSLPELTSNQKADYDARVENYINMTWFYWRTQEGLLQGVKRDIQNVTLKLDKNTYVKDCTNLLHQRVSIKRRINKIQDDKLLFFRLKKHHQRREAEEKADADEEKNTHADNKQHSEKPIPTRSRRMSKAM